MIDVTDLKRAVAMAWCGQGQFKVEGLMLHCGSDPLSLLDLFGAGPFFDLSTKRGVAGRRKRAGFAGSDKSSID
jgi:hypothetical protein